MDEMRLLILDDEAQIGEMICLLVQSAGFEARSTIDPNTFFGLLESWNPTHICLDLVMPEMDGVEVIGALAKAQCTATIIILSGVNTRVIAAAERSAAEHGLLIAGSLSKPFRPDSFLDLLSRCPPTVSSSHALGVVAEFDESDLEAGIQRQEFYVAYQPKINLKTSCIAGFEALLRWKHPEVGLIPPDVFIPVAERVGLISQLTYLVVDHSFAWHSRVGIGSIAINLSARSLDNADFVENVVSLGAKYGISTDNVIFELTETSAMADPTASLDLLTRLRVKGFHLSIDDFGTGFSSMQQLVRLPFSEIKVDRSFCMTARTSEESRSVIRSILTLGSSLGLRTVAEGVEDAETLDYLANNGCDLAQGYHIARPMPAAEASSWLTSRAR